MGCPKERGEPLFQYFFAVSRPRLAIDNLTPSIASLDYRSRRCKGQAPFLP